MVLESIGKQKMLSQSGRRLSSVGSFPWCPNGVQIPSKMSPAPELVKLPFFATKMCKSIPHLTKPSNLPVNIQDLPPTPACLQATALVASCSLLNYTQIDHSLPAFLPQIPCEPPGPTHERSRPSTTPYSSTAHLRGIRYMTNWVPWSSKSWCTVGILKTVLLDAFGYSMEMFFNVF